MEFILVNVDCDRQGRPLALHRVESLGKLTCCHLAGPRCSVCDSESSSTNAVYLGDTVDVCQSCLQRSGAPVSASLAPISLSALFPPSL